MKNLLALVGLVVVGVGGVGWYLGWYQIGSEPAPNGHRHIEVDVNAKKIADDLKKGEQKVSGILHTNDGKGTTVIPTPEKKDIQPVGLQFTNDGATIILPPLNIGGKKGN